jgi:hypothetical protein
VVVHVEFYGFFDHALADSGPECAFQLFSWHSCFPSGAGLVCACEFLWFVLSIRNVGLGAERAVRKKKTSQ